MTRIALLMLLGLTCPTVVSAQGPRQFTHRSGATSQLDLTAVRESVRRGITAGERGALVGGLLGFAAGGALYLQFADNDSGGSSLGGFLLGGVILAIPGAVVGGLIGSSLGRRRG